MPNPTKRYYRVAEKDQQFDDVMYCDEMTFKHVCSIAFGVYLLSLCISFIVGCLLGSSKNCK